MELFDIALYALAIITVLLLRAESHTATVAPTDPKPQPETIEAPQPLEVMPQPAPAPAMPATIAPPVVSVTIRTEGSTATEAPATDYQAMTSAQLRKICTAAGIRWRNVHGTRHLTKGEMIAALAK